MTTPSPTPASPATTDEPPLKVLFVPPTYNYAYGPGYFTRIESPEDYDNGVKSGLWPTKDQQLTVDEKTRAAIEDICLRGVPKDDAPSTGTPPIVGGAKVGRGYVYLDEFKTKANTKANSDDPTAWLTVHADQYPSIRSS